VIVKANCKPTFFTYEAGQEVQGEVLQKRLKPGLRRFSRLAKAGGSCPSSGSRGNTERKGLFLFLLLLLLVFVFI